MVTAALAASLCACTGDGGVQNGPAVTTTAAKTNAAVTESARVTEGASSVITTAANTNEIISRDRAIELALDHAGVDRNSVFDLEAERDRDRGGIYWEVDFEDGKLEYSYDINAETGEVIRVERERD